LDLSNDYGFTEYLTGKHTKDRLGLNFSYILSGVEFGARSTTSGVVRAVFLHRLGRRAWN